MDTERVREVRLRAAERERRQIVSIRPVGLALLAVYLIAAARSSPHPAVHGRGLGGAAALAGFTAASLWLMLTRRPVDSPRGVIETAGVLGVAGACLTAAAALQPSAPAVLGLTILVYAAGARLPIRPGAAAAGAVTLAVDAAVVSAGRSVVYVTANALLAALLFLVAVLVRRSRAAQDRAELLAARLADSLELREVAARLEERGRIARDLHDVLAHSLSGLSIQLEGARLMARREAASDELNAALERAVGLARAGTDEARRAVAALRGSDVPGAERLGELVAGFTTDTGIAADLEVSGEPSALPAEASSTLYRACQEALTNIARHSGSDRAELRLAYGTGSVTLTVADHRDAASTRRPLLPDAGSGYGLRAMSERIARAGGTLTAGPTADGWQIEVILPR